MPLSLASLKHWTEVRGVLRDHGHDFWASCNVRTTPMEMANKLPSMRVEGELFAEEAFTHAYIAPSKDVRADLNALIDEFGLGLRRKRACSQAEPGCVLVLVSEGGPSALKRRRTGLAPDDKALSTEERVRRTRMKFEVVSADKFGPLMESNKAGFWLTSWSNVDAEAGKRKAVAMTVEGGVPAVQRFERCLLAESRNCQEATERLCLLHGLGGRKSMVRSRPEPGCLALLLPHAAPPGADADSDSDASSSSSASESAASDSGSSSPSQDSFDDLAEELFGPYAKDESGPLLPLLPFALDTPEKEKAPPKTPQPPPVAKSEGRPALPAPSASSASTALALPAPASASAPRTAGSPAPALALCDAPEEIPVGALTHGRWAELSRQGLTCVALDDWTEVSGLLRDLGHDFWVGGAGCDFMDEVADRLASMRVEDHPVVGTFTHCYIAKSEDTKADLLSVTEDFGYGLRKNASSTRRAPGYVYLLASRGRPSALAVERSKLAAVDRKLSTEERVRRTHLQFEASSLQAMLQQARRNQGSFCLTAYRGADVEACKKKIVSCELQGAPATTRFARCLLAEARDCRAATEQLEKEAGLGCRNSRVRSSHAPGCLAMLLPAAAARPAAGPSGGAGAGGSRPELIDRFVNLNTMAVTDLED